MKFHILWTLWFIAVFECLLWFKQMHVCLSAYVSVLGYMLPFMWVTQRFLISVRCQNKSFLTIGLAARHRIRPKWFEWPTDSLTHWLPHPLTPSPTDSPTHWLPHPLIPSPTDSPTHWPPPTDSLPTDSPTHWLPHPLTPPPTDSPTH